MRIIFGFRKIKTCDNDAACYLSLRFGLPGLSFRMSFLISVTWIGIIGMLSKTDFADSRMDRFLFRIATAELMSPDICARFLAFFQNPKNQLFGSFQKIGFFHILLIFFFKEKAGTPKKTAALWKISNSFIFRIPFELSRKAL